MQVYHQGVETKADWNRFPNELWSEVFSNLKTMQLVQSFSGLNQCFEDLIYSSNCVRLNRNIEIYWINTYMPRFQQNIKKISLHSSNANSVFNGPWSFQNLEYITIFNHCWLISLRFGKGDFRNALKHLSTLINQINYSYECYLYFSLKDTFQTFAHDWRTVSYPFIERISIGSCSIVNLSIILNHAPKLRHLRMHNIIDKDSNTLHGTDVNFDVKEAHLHTLIITKGHLFPNQIFEQLVKCSKITLEKISFIGNFQYPIDGTFLEEIVKSCEKLTQIKFFIQIQNFHNDLELCIQSFQSQWWLNNRRLIMFIQPNDEKNISILSIPYRYYFSCKNDLSYGSLSKENLDYQLVRFYGVCQLYLNHICEQLHSLEYLYTIGRIFNSSSTGLITNSCDIDSVEIVYELLSNSEYSLAKPAFLNMTRFIVDSDKTLESLTLCVWILLMPNLKVFDIHQLDLFNKRGLGKQLLYMISVDQRLESNFDAIEEIIIFSKQQILFDNIKQEIAEDFGKVFRNANLSIK